MVTLCDYFIFKVLDLNLHNLKRTAWKPEDAWRCRAMGEIEVQRRKNVRLRWHHHDVHYRKAHDLPEHALLTRLVTEMMIGWDRRMQTSDSESYLATYRPTCVCVCVVSGQLTSRDVVSCAHLVIQRERLIGLHNYGLYLFFGGGQIGVYTITNVCTAKVHK